MQPLMIVTTADVGAIARLVASSAVVLSLAVTATASIAFIWSGRNRAPRRLPKAELLGYNLFGAPSSDR